MEPTLFSLTGSLTAQGNGAMMAGGVNAVGSLLGIGMRFALVILLAFVVFYCIVGWKLFKKAGRNGYEVLISGHNLYTYITIAGKPGWYFFLLLIPYAIMMIPALIIGITQTASPVLLGIFSALGALGFLYLYIDLTFSFTKKFKKSTGFGFGLLLLPFIFYPILALGDSKYILNHQKNK